MYHKVRLWTSPGPNQAESYLRGAHFPRTKGGHRNLFDPGTPSCAGSRSGGSGGFVVLFVRVE